MHLDTAAAHRFACYRDTFVAAFGLAVATALGLAPGAFAQTPEEAPQTSAPAERPPKPHYKIPRISTPIKIDGVLDDPAWKEALAVDVNNEFDPRRNVPAPVTTIAYLAYDDDNLYAGFRANAPDPEAIRAHLTDRDAAFKDDFVGLIIDTFNDERRGYEFFVNPLGVQMDLSLNEMADVEEDTAWDAIWDSAGRIDDQGYVVEMAIPFSSIRFQRTNGEQTWGIGPFRSHKRSFRHQIASTYQAPDDGCFVCQSPKMTGFEGIKPGLNLELDPTLTGKRTDSRLPDLQGPIVEGDEQAEVGLTARWGITPNLTFSGAVNPDFSQIEADAIELNVDTQFAIFFPEKRPFFLEAADFFQTPFNAVYTRTVADPRWGAKLTGKVGKNAIGVFVAEDDETNFLIPTDQFSGTGKLVDADLRDVRTTDAALRFRRDVGAGSTIGALVTHREGEDGDYFNSVGGIDGRWRPTAADVVTAQVLSSQTEYPESPLGPPPGRLEGDALTASYDHTDRHWNWYAKWEDVDDEFRGDLGFIPQVGYEFSNVGLERTWWANSRDSWYSSISLGTDWDQTNAENGTVLNQETELYVRLKGPWQSTYLLDRATRHRFWNMKTYREKYTLFTADVRPSGSLGMTLLAQVGDTIDFDNDRPGDLLRIRPTVSFNFGRHLQASIDHDLQKVDVEDGELLELNVSQLSAIYQFNVRMFVRAILQYQDVEFESEPNSEDLFGQLLFSYKLNPTTVFFLGYSDNQLNRLDQDGRLIGLRRAERTFFFKIGYALVL